MPRLGEQTDDGVALAPLVTLFGVALDRWLDQDQATPQLAEALEATISSFRILSDD